ncbi:Coiled-coil domain-containing protein 92 [Merluccius polli]|uniref:Coiled-coil domain-containing protein 92 n=1 Tax=Merluccius polli TaxID=89951 RepID=A0AA47N6F1_MERPO|nr:Coiled-coil domain-containing protein 92 [Merluccius polli]
MSIRAKRPQSAASASASAAAASSASAAMETEELQQQVASVERGMAFLKREHLAMLTGLQLEITRLKRRCHELDCELDARFPQRTAAEECELAARRRASEGLLGERESAAVVVRTELRARQVRAWALGCSLKGDERRFLEELKRRSHKITTLGRELHRQTLTTTTLCHELHSARMRLYRRSQVAGEGEEGEEDEEEEEEEEEGAGGAQQEEVEREEEWECDEEEEDDGGEGADWLPSPASLASPGQSDELCRRRASVREQRVRACVPCERVTSPQRPHPMPDPALFLVPLRYRLLRWKRPMRVRGNEEGLQDEWEDLVEDGRVRRRVDMGAAEGETAL